MPEIGKIEVTVVPTLDTEAYDELAQKLQDLNIRPEETAERLGRASGILIGLALAIFLASALAWGAAWLWTHLPSA